MHGYATFPGVESVRSATMAWTHGISPSRCSLEIAPQKGRIETNGTLRFFFGSEEIAFKDCVADYGSAEYTGSGEIWRIQILDRRYKWAWGQVSGSYNLRYSDGTIQAATRKTPRELAKLCLDAMGEAGGDVRALPEDEFPTVEWDFTNPADALAELCDMFGCYVVLGLNNRVKIRRVGVGDDLPDGPMISAGFDENPPEKPSKIAMVCGPNRYQVDFELEAVGLDTDGKIKPIDELSYKPEGGWSKVVFPQCTAVSTTTARELAIQSVYRWYRVKEPITVPGYSLAVQDRRNILPLIGLQCETVLETANDGTRILRDQEAQVYGVWFLRYDADANSVASLTPMDKNTMSGALCKRPWALDSELGIVKFAEPIYRNTAAENAPHVYAAAQLRLRASCNVRDAATRALVRFTHDRAVGPRGNPVRYVQQNDLVLRFIPTYGNAFNVARLDDNKADVLAECNHNLDSLVREYQTVNGATVPYAGLIAQDLDGAIRQVTWSIGPDGTTTTVSRNTEQRARCLPYQRRRAAERQRAAQRTAVSGVLRAVRRWSNMLGRWLS